MRNANDIVRVKVLHNQGTDASKHTFEIDFITYDQYLSRTRQKIFEGSEYTLYPYKWYGFIRRYSDMREYKKQKHIQKHGYHPKTNVLSDKSNWILLTYAGTVLAAGFTFGLWFSDYTRTDDIRDTREELIKKMDELISISRANAFASQKNNHSDH
jgi:hypothetical protein